MLKRAGLYGNRSRNAAIVEVAHRLAATHKLLILVAEVWHGTLLAEQVSRTVDPVFFFKGGSELLVFRHGQLDHSATIPVTELAEHLARCPSYVLLGSPAVGEDVDFPDANVLVVAGAGRKFQRTIQRAGRVLRPQGGASAAIIDFTDKTSFVLQYHSKLRAQSYRERYGRAAGFRLLEHRTVEDVLAAIVQGA